MNQAVQIFSRVPGFTKIMALPRPVQLGIAAAMIALVAVAAMWARKPDYGVLFSNLDDRDGGAIVSALGQLNIPYQFSDNGTAILVPTAQVPEARMQLASQGLPKAGNVGFELLDQSRFGASQFTEQVTYQRALEGELANSIQALHSVQEARVHLAIPRETLFVRDRQEPTASVLLSLYPGRNLGEDQVSAITWLVSSSVPNLNAQNVSVVDQNGRLLTMPVGEGGVNSQQQNMVNDIEHRSVQRILTLLNPILGAGNVRAQVSADMDFAKREETSEIYRPNQRPGEAAVRSEQSSTSINNNSLPAEGVPGALSNQPPVDPVAPIVNPVANAAEGTATEAAAPQDQQQNALRNLNEQAREVSATGNARRDVTTNYEVDRTISHIKGPNGQLKRLSVAVVVNYRHEQGELVALDDSELENIRELVKQAVGFSVERGDSISVVNSRFSDLPDTSVPFWKNNDYLELGMSLIKYLLLAILFFVFWRIVINPIIQGFIQASAQADARRAEQDQELERQQQAQDRASEINRYEDNLSTARSMAEQDPRAVAMVLRSWMTKENKDEKRG
ncbi:flagellar basal-body MS-ring/collar protein FliF [Paenalcaligenes suwonensis]|uniref:flagellar basal-body MS-ring/collar protein FliF n=1 Tax=Paenalcaligenes suwonensis TaxID=1202713 RepID=UPI00140A6ED6|nr:flagellar basal body M-ring protein FliF [Paenalcaligenes suwonensis]